MIYTAVTGGRDKGRDDIKCFTEYDRFKDPCLNAKIYKVLPHLFLDTEHSVWVDANIELKISEDELISMLKGKEIGVFRHPDRSNIHDEAEICKHLGKDDPKIIDEQIKRYDEAGFSDDKGLGACYIIVRKHTSVINRLNERWWAEITRGSRRDQLSFPYVFGNVVKYFPPRPDNNEFFIRKPHDTHSR